jgi:uncharacterized protein (DUF427 family)
MDSINRQGISIRPYRGVLRVSFSDAIVASSDNALIVQAPGAEPVYYVPFKDIYFDFLQRSDSPPRGTPMGAATYWGVSAVGEAASDAMWVHEAPAVGFEALQDHGAFDPDKVLIETTDLPDAARTA